MNCSNPRAWFAPTSARGSFVAGSAAPPPTTFDWESRFLSAPPLAPAVPPLPEGPGVISFATARPAEDLFPLDAFRAACREVIDSGEAADVLRLGSPFGYAPLRSYLLDAAAPGDDLMVTSGCQQALDLIERLFTRPGDTVLVEDPVYPGLRNVFLQAGVRVVGVPMTADGIDIDFLAAAILRERPRLLVVTPNFQNPTGATLPLSARRALLEHTRAGGVVVVENDIYGELRYRGTSLPTLRQLDQRGDTLQLKSFSKLAFPGLRVGWVTGPSAVIARLAELKQATDLHSDQLSQAVLLRFAVSGRLAEHRRRMLEAGSARLSAVLAACERHLPPRSRFTRPEGGMNLWVRLPEPLDASALLGAAHERRVTYLPGRFFAVSHAEPGGLRLSFAALAPPSIEAGLAALGDVFRTALGSSPTGRPAGLAPAIV